MRAGLAFWSQASIFTSSVHSWGMTDNWVQNGLWPGGSCTFSLSAKTVAKTVSFPGLEGIAHDETGGAGPPKAVKTELPGSLAAGCAGTMGVGAAKDIAGPFLAPNSEASGTPPLSALG